MLKFHLGWEAMCDQLLLRAVIYFNNIKTLKIFNVSG